MKSIYQKYLLILLILTMPTSSGAQEFVKSANVREGSTVLDYFERKIVINGTGAAGDEHDSSAERRVWALNEARKNCYTLAAMTIGEVSVYGKTLLEVGRVKSENIEIHIRNYVRGISDIKENTERYPDGSYLATVTMTIMFDGNKGLNNLLYSYIFDEHRVHSDSTASASIKTAQNPVTGIVVDATGVNLVPSISPAIYDVAGRLVYGPESFSRNYALRIGIAGYTKDLNNVTDRIGGQPYGIKAVALQNGDPSSVVISKEDADKLINLDREFGLLGSCRVVFMVK